MHIMWRGLELPGRVLRDENVSNESYARFVIEPFEQGFGTTIGNSLRRVLLSSLEGAAITTAKINGVAHEFCSIDGVLEDVTEILLNVKEIVVAYDGIELKTVSVHRDAAGEVRAGDIVTDSSVTVANPDHLIATLTTDVSFHAEFTVETGRGYSMASEHRAAEEVVGVIPVDAVFSPVQRVRYRTENMRVGQKTNYDRLILEIWTNGTILPEDALVEAGMILRKHLTPFVMYDQYGGGDMVTLTKPIKADATVHTDAALEGILEKPISVLNLSVRAANCLEAAKINRLHELVAHSEAELLRFRSFGKTSLVEVVHKLADIGLSLGMFKGGENAHRMQQVGGVFGSLSDDGPHFSGDFGIGGSSADSATGDDEPSSPSPNLGQVSFSGDAESRSQNANDASSSTQGGPMAAYTMDD